MKIGFIGAGKMAGALVRGVIRAEVVSPNDVRVTDLHPAASAALHSELGVVVAETNSECIAAADIVFLCVKPADAATALRDCRDALSGKLVISIMAGIDLEGLSGICGDTARVVRAMPNTAALVAASATAYVPGPGVTAADLKIVHEIFEAIGLAVQVPEKSINAVTGLSGSGPAYAFLIIEALAEAGVHVGLPRPLAQQLAVQTVYGAGKLAAESAEHPAVLREAVTSPGGTTAAGLAVLEAAAVRSAIIEAVAAARDRADELG